MMKRLVIGIIGMMLLASTAFAANGDLTVDGTIHSVGSHYRVLSYSYNATPTYGIKIRTNIPFGVASMPTIMLEGYVYSLATPINLMISWYVYNGNYVAYGASSATEYYPTIKLAKETRSGTDYVVIYIDDRRHYARFSIRAYAYGRGEQDAWFESWPAPTDEMLTESNVVTVPYRTGAPNVTVTTNGVAGSSAAPLYPALDFVGYLNHNKARIRASEESTSTNGSEFSILVNDGSSATDLVERFTIRKDGNVGIGTNDPSFKLQVMGSVASNTTVLTSDSRFKKNLLQITSPLEKLLNLNGLSYEWKADEFKERNFPAGRHYGVIAQEVEKVLPEVVSTAPDGSKAVAYTELIPVLIEAIKEQQKRIEVLEQRLATGQ